MENSPETYKKENQLQREMLDMNKQTIQHMERDINWFKSWWMMAIVYPLVVTVGGTILVTVIQKHRAKTPARRTPVERDTEVRRPVRDAIRDRVQQ